MHQALVSAWGENPRYVETEHLPAPGQDEIRVKVEATGVHRVVRSRASGKHYSARNLPHVPGVDGVGRTEDGQLVYFTSFSVGSMAEVVNMPRSAVFPLPQNADPAQVAGSVNPAMSSWMAFKSRTANLPSDFTCLVVGATSASGRVAIPLLRALGAKTVIGAARNRSALDSLQLDRMIVLDEDPEKTDFGNLDDVDVVFDYVFGPVAVQIFKSLRTPKPVQYVHVGALSTGTITIPGEILRSKDITIRGAGPGSWRMPDFLATLPELLKIMATLPKQPVHEAELKDVEREWSYQGSERLVFVI